MSEPEVILAGSHASRTVVGGVVIWRDNLPCDPDCEPEKGIHVIRSTTSGESSVNRLWPEADTPAT